MKNGASIDRLKIGSASQRSTGLAGFRAWRIVSCMALAVAAGPAQAMAGQRSTAPAGEHKFRRGVNILAHDPLWKNPAKGRFQSRHFAEIRRGGFDFVRVNLLVFKHMDARNRIDPGWLKRLDWVVANAKRAGLGVILDEHDTGPCKQNVPACRAKLPAVWRQLASRYRAEPASVAFELFNEPDDFFEGQTWEAMIPQLLSIIRANNPTRTVIVAPRRLEDLALPPGDRNIMVTFHYYGPFRFTHQGTPWTSLRGLRGVAWGSPANRQRVREVFDAFAAWSRKNRRPILLGEFGAYDQSGTPLGMRVNYTATIACHAERRGFAWAYWQFTGNFVVWDMARDTWVKPIKDALIPRRARPRNC
jgi:endoglucanase